MSHVVTQPRPPFAIANGALEVHQVPAWQDNLIWLIVCPETREAAVVDGPEAGATLSYVEERGFRLTTILNTHTHGDHVGINRDLNKRGLLGALKVVGPARAADDVPGLTVPVDDGDKVVFAGVEGAVMLTEGHLDGHVSYLFGDALFCGDTMFGAGCGYLFDGPPSKMHQSLQRLSALAPETRVCCAHEYTQDNLRFAWSLEPDNAALVERIRRVWDLRSRGECSVPSTMGEERATNPFLRVGSPTLLAALARAMPEVSLDDEVAIFTAIRALKDRKLYRETGDERLPLG